MERLDRFQQVHRALKGGACRPMAWFLERLEVSRATFKRDIEYMRDRMHAPITWDRDRRGYCYDPAQGDYELPGLWFNAAEVQALLVMDAMLRDIGGGLLDEHIKPLTRRLTEILDEGQFKPSEIRSRIRILHLAARRAEPEHFSAIAQGVLARRRLRIRHWNRGKDEHTDRTISPQRLVHYRENWYVDAWCHLRKGLRTFALDAIEKVEPLEAKARDVADGTLDRHFKTSYGIFSGEPTERAILLFEPEVARWVSREVWHPEQEMTHEDDGSLVLEIPYNDPRELVMDILRYGSAVEVVGPESLRKRLVEELDGARKLYS